MSQFRMLSRPGTLLVMLALAASACGEPTAPSATSEANGTPLYGGYLGVDHRTMPDSTGMENPTTSLSGSPTPEMEGGLF